MPAFPTSGNAWSSLTRLSASIWRFCGGQGDRRIDDGGKSTDLSDYLMNSFARLYPNSRAAVAMAATMPIVRLDGVKKTYKLGEVDIPALIDVDVSIRRGDFISFVGPSGSGKTTMMNMVGLVDTPTSGTVYLGGKNMTEAPDRERTDARHRFLGFIFQTFNLMPILNIFENIEMPLLIGREVPTKAERKERVNRLIAEVGLERWTKHKPAELSGGQRQRVAIARALITQPLLVLADEPTANLDSNTGEMILDLMKKVNREYGTTFIFSTHDTVIRDMADHVIQLKDGRIVHDNLAG